MISTDFFELSYLPPEFEIIEIQSYNILHSSGDVEEDEENIS